MEATNFLQDFIRQQAEWLNSDKGDLNEQDGIDCPKCKNKGLIFFADGISVRSYRCDCMSRRETVRLAKRSGCADLLKVYRFDRYQTPETWQKAVKQAALEFAEKDAGAFFVGGSVGCGKTFICTAIVNRMLERQRECRYWVWKDLATKMNQLVGDSPFEYEQLLDEVTTVEVLYLDDFLKIRPTEAELDKAFKVLNARYSATIAGKSLITILSSEKSLEEIIAVDEAIGSRLKQLTGKFSFAIKGKDKNWRLK